MFEKGCKYTYTYIYTYRNLGIYFHNRFHVGLLNLIIVYTTELVKPLVSLKVEFVQVQPCGENFSLFDSQT